LLQRKPLRTARRAALDPLHVEESRAPMSRGTTKTFPDLMLVRTSESRAYSPEPGLNRRILAHNASMMLVEHSMQSDWVGTRHSHPHDQLVYVISGRLRFSCGTDTFEASAGDSFVLRGGIEHEARALEASRVLDVFTPYREDYLPDQG
jgi:unsaturated pyranuronate lyase